MPCLPSDELMLVGMVDTGPLVGIGGMRAGEYCSVYLGLRHGLPQLNKLLKLHVVHTVIRSPSFSQC